MQPAKKIIVSICCTAYNHERFIKQCLDGFVMQKTNFDFEILINDDASTDDTAKIIKKYELEYPNLFRCIYQSENQYYKQNVLINVLFKMARGKYIAICEGDDYWTDPYKLQKQVDFLENNPDFSITFHKVNVINEIKNTSYLSNKIQKEISTICDLAEYNFIHTVSVFFKNDNLQIPDWFFNCPVGDYPLHLINSQKGKIKFFEDVMAVYRINNQSTWATQDFIKVLFKWAEMLNFISDKFDKDVSEILLKQRTKSLFTIIWKSILNFDKLILQTALKTLDLSFFKFIAAFFVIMYGNFKRAIKILNFHFKKLFKL